MVRALVLKELRESAAVVAIAAAVALLQLATLTGFGLAPGGSASPLESFPFVNDGLMSSLTLVGAGLAIALGLKQTAWEAGQNTYHFLLHRPASLRRIFGWKMAVGVGLTLLAPGVMILLYALWAATPGAHAAPFRWSMTLPAWSYWAALPVLYVGAFASGLRPARWYATRLAPLVVASVVVFLFVATPAWLLTAPLLLATLVGLLATSSHHASTRDF